MPTNRIPISRPRHRTFTAEILTLFTELTELENTSTPRHWRKKQEFARKSQHLASQLGLCDAWWMGLRVEKIHEQQRPREGLAAHDWWPRVRAVRKQLLEAIAAREIQPTDEEARPAP